MKIGTANTPQEQKIIQSTVNYFRRYPHKRGLSGEGGGCVYVTDNGCRCAVGKWMTEKVVTNKDFIEELNGNGDLQQIFSDVNCDNDVEQLNESLIPDYIHHFDDMMVHDAKGLSYAFWFSLQVWHDESMNFNKVGLTTQGYERAVNLGWVDPR